MLANTVLYVEDDEGEAYLFTVRMQEHGYKIDIAKNVEDGIERFNPRTHFIVITDWNLPDGEAPDVIRGVQAKQPSIPTIALSSCFKEEFLEEAEKLGVTKCLTKSTKCEHLNDIPSILKDILKNKE